MPPTLERVFQLTWTFDLQQGSQKEDIAEFGLWFNYGPGGSIDQTDLDFVAQNGADAWQQQVSGAHYGTNVSLRNVTGRCFSTNGHTFRESQKAPASAWVGTNSDACLPWETSLCIGLYTYVPNTFVPDGKSRRGRYYLPPMAAAVLEGGNSGFVQNALIAPLLAEQVAFYGKLYAGAGFDPLVVEPIVYSRTQNDFNLVEYLVCDAKLDSQRRRQNRESAGRISHAIS